MSAEALELEVQASRMAREDLAWLVKKLGRARVSDPVRDGAGDWMVELVRADGRRTWHFGSTPEYALGRARAHVQASIDAARAGRRAS